MSFRIILPTLQIIVIYFLSKSLYDFVLVFCYYDSLRTQKQPPEVFFLKKMFLISQNSQETTCDRAATLFKTRLWHRYFLVNFAELLKALFLENISVRLLLRFVMISVVLLCLFCDYFLLPTFIYF